MVDAFANQYGWTLEYTRDELPFCQALALMRAIKSREQPEEDKLGYAGEESLGDMSGIAAALAAARKNYMEHQKRVRATPVSPTPVPPTPRPARRRPCEGGRSRP